MAKKASLLKQESCYFIFEKTRESGRFWSYGICVGQANELACCLPMGGAGYEKIKHIRLDIAARERENSKMQRKNNLLRKRTVVTDII